MEQGVGEPRWNELHPMKAVDTFLLEMIRAGGSDLHLPSGSPPMVRIHGELKPLDMPRLESEQVRQTAMEILSAPLIDHLLEEATVDFVYEMEDGPPAMRRFRANAFYQKHGLNLVFRGISARIPTLDDLGLPEVLQQLTHHHHGLALVVGPSGCGKSSTLAALVQHINETRACHVITLEDPIEYVFDNDWALVVQRQVGNHVESFATALRAALREDPDVIVVGEMRDLETISLAITAAETGHLVLGTLHTRSSVQTVQRIIDSFPSGQQSQIRTMLSESLRGVVCQQLVPRLDGTGRVVAYELLLVNASVGNLIREGKDYQMVNAIQMGRARGMRSMDESLLDLARGGLISTEAALDRAGDPKTLAAQFDSLGGGLS